MRCWSLLVVSVVACASARTKAPDPQACAGDRRALVTNLLSAPIDIRSSQGVIGTVQPGERGEFVVPRGQSVTPTASASATARFGLSADDRKRVDIRYACTE
jgi:hypothetical protein